MKLKLVYPKPKQVRYGASKSQRAQRQMAWALYITEGFRANMFVAGKHELSSSDREFLKAISREAGSWAFKIRQRLEKE